MKALRFVFSELIPETGDGGRGRRTNNKLRSRLKKLHANMLNNDDPDSSIVEASGYALVFIEMLGCSSEFEDFLISMHISRKHGALVGQSCPCPHSQYVSVNGWQFLQ